MLALTTPRILAVWTALMVITLASWWLGSDHGVSRDLASSAILVLSFVKARFVALDFMELRSAPPWLRTATEGVLAVSCAALVGLLLLG